MTNHSPGASPRDRDPNDVSQPHPCQGDPIALDRIQRHAGGGLRRIAESAKITIARGEGSYLVDTAGRRYLDATTGYGVAALGHAHPAWVSAVQRQAAALAVCPFHSAALGSYLERLAALLPPALGRIALFSGGAEATETAVRMARRATGKPAVLSFTTAFHGKSHGVRYTGGAHLAERAADASHYPHVRYPACLRHTAVTYPSCTETARPTGDELRRRDDLDQVAGVIVEPVLGTAGNVPPVPDLLVELRRTCDRRGWILIADEAITGFGRTGAMFGFERFHAVPDILVLGKAIGGGYPLSAVAAPAELWHASGLDAPSATSSSYGANPLACAAGSAVLSVVTEPQYLSHVAGVGAVLASGLDDLAAAVPRVTRARGLGMMLGFDLVSPESGALAPADQCAEIFRQCLDRGVLLPIDVPRVRISPPLTLSHAEADQLISVLFEALT